ncbi:MAG: M20/M25/M40 family metallo-hydrolase [Bacteroidota bacterium]|nr:M20/M25/M40 family metallo-hydrolase [Bacteroidota bacterium]
MFFLIPSFVFAQQEINIQEVDKIIKILSSDTMEGRKVFTTGIDKAADFIEEEFREIDLKYFHGLENYRQSFTVSTTAIHEASLHLNSNKIEEKDFWVQSPHENINWRDIEKIKIQRIRSGEDFNQRYAEIMKVPEDGLILVSHEHKQIFSRFQSRFSATRISMGNIEAASRIFVLRDPEKIKSIEARIQIDKKEQVLKNIVGVIPGSSKPDKFILFTAHYDHLGIMPAIAGDSIANGADDNASGTAAVISLARYFQSRTEPERTLVFVAFTAEEVGAFGSRYFSQQVQPEKIIAMINIEMIGTPSKFGPHSAFLTGFERSTLGNIMQENLREQIYKIHADPYPEQNLFYRSDNATLARLGVPAHTISSSQIDKDPFYHTVQDEYENIHIEHLTHMIRAIALSVQSIIAGDATPSRLSNR